MKTTMSWSEEESLDRRPINKTMNYLTITQKERARICVFFDRTWVFPKLLSINYSLKVSFFFSFCNRKRKRVKKMMKRWFWFEKIAYMALIYANLCLFATEAKNEAVWAWSCMFVFVILKCIELSMIVEILELSSPCALFRKLKELIC